MTKAILSLSRSFYGASHAWLGPMCIVLLLTAACGRDVRTERVGVTTALKDPGIDSTNALSGRIRALTTLDVESAQVGPQRTDITLIAPSGLTNPDSEQVALASLSERLWQDAQLRIHSETLAIAVVRPLHPGGGFERSTYFYYRSRRQPTTQP